MIPSKKILFSGVTTIFVLILFSFVYVAFLGPPESAASAGSSCTPQRFSLTSSQGCVSRAGFLYCPPTASVQSCTSTAQGNVLVPCHHGFCGLKILDMGFEQVPPVDSSGAANHGTCTACPVNAQGKFGKGIQLDGLQYVEIPTLAQFAPPQVTILFWVKPSSNLATSKGVLLTNRRTLISEGIDISINGPFGTLFEGGAGAITVSTNDGTQSQVAFSAANLITFDDWSHVAAVVDLVSGNAKIYYNGVEKVHSPVNRQVLSQTQPWRVGGYTSGIYGFVGSIDELRIEQRILSQTEILADIARAAVCGNTITEGLEQCDDGNQDNNDACRNNCERARCGDAIVWTGQEMCDDGNSNDNDVCRNGCVNAFCGDGVLLSGREVCDDGNQANDDACLNTCNLAVCGDGILRTGVEQCDDSNTVNTDSCAFCRIAVCGDGFVQSGVEQCDDRNTLSNDGCSVMCVTETCTDGIRNNHEMGVDCGGPCAACTIVTCGNGIIEAGEQCDDGNTAPNDGCSSSCQDEPQCVTDMDCAFSQRCDNGVCVPIGGGSLLSCIDGDNGVAPYFKTSTTNGVFQKSDFCSDFNYFNLNQQTELSYGNLLYEQVCINGQQRSIVFACSCRDGQCVDFTVGTPSGTCTNTDGSVFTPISTQSVTRGTTRANTGVWFSDYCVWNPSGGTFPSGSSPLLNSVREFSCGIGGISPSGIISSVVSCANGCKAGACCDGLFSCTFFPSFSSTGCGDGIVQANEQCDPSGSACSNGACTVNCKCPSNSCLDYDNGINVYTKSEVDGISGIQQDYCTTRSAYESGVTLPIASGGNGDALVEMVCASTGDVSTQVIYCNCQDGKCV
ncbi:MAG TPA: DUF4215 domain-containing protein [Candidatus Nanoarchaeia archaeon]|nr:DUF4215 domain-containing protein [Candidatus Nanoarchaeia archaeon]